MSYKKTLLVGRGTATRPGDAGNVTVEVEIRDTPKGPELSMCGNVWRVDKRDIISGGQNLDHIKDDIHELRIPAAQLDRMIDVWRRWHLNGMRAGCEHQRATWGDVTRTVEVVTYKLTHDAQRLRDKTRARLADAALRGELLELTPTERALAELADWFRPIFDAPDADSPFSGCYEVKSREQKAIGWTYPHEHPEGILGKSCPTCGYKYGTAWRYEPLPADIIDEIKSWEG